MGKITLCKSKEITVKEAFEEFIHEKKRNGLSKDTLISYRNMFHIFEIFFDVNKECNEITSFVYESYKDYLTMKHQNLNTVNTYLRNIRAIFNWFIQKHYVSAFNMQLVKVDDTVKEIYTDEEIRKLLVRPNTKTCCFSEYRTWVVINYILATGNRLGTIIEIQNHDIRHDKQDIFLRKSKGRKQYYIPMSAQLQKVLLEYQDFRGGKPTDYLFCTERGKQISVSGLQSAMIRYCNKRNVNKNSEHLLRHYFAHKYYVNGGDVMALNFILGHKDINMTRHYLNLYASGIERETFDSANPLDRLSQKQRIKMR